MAKLFRIKNIIFLIIILAAFPLTSMADEGDCGYEGGISSGQAVDKKYDYKEVIFITGKPIVVEGSLSVKKTLKDTAETWTYTYANLKNTQEKVMVNRTVSYNVTLAKSGSQIKKQAALKGTPSEKITVDKTTYTLKRYSFSKSTIVDAKPLSQYFAGEFLGEKTYSIAGGTGVSNGTVTISSTGKVFGYNQYWSNTEAQIIEYTIQSAQNKLKWNGKAKVSVSMTSAKKLSYEKNKPEEISFEGGYLQKQSNSSVLQYESELPEFDSKGEPTDYLIKSKDTLNLDAFPSINRLVVPALPQLKGHWAENDVKLLYSLEIFKDKPEDFKINAFMTRAEFAKAIILAGHILGDDEIAKAEAGETVKKSGANEEEGMVFQDVPQDHPYYTYIKEAYNRKIMEGMNRKEFWPESTVTRAQAVTLFIRMLGFENRAPSPIVVTSFADNSDIPSWARNSIYVAEKIGLIKGDTYGNVNANKRMTKEEAAVMLNRFINYMRQDIIKDYRENAILW